MTTVTIDDREADEGEAYRLRAFVRAKLQHPENQDKPIRHYTWHYAWDLAKESPCMI